MSRPTQVFIGPDGPNFEGEPKIKLNFLLYSTARTGRVLETIFVRVRNGETIQSFPIWVFGNRSGLNRGSGLYVSPEGIAGEHHFLMAADDKSFILKAGKLKIDVVARLIGDSNDIELGSCSIQVSPEHAQALTNKNCAVFYDWGGERREYQGKIDERLSVEQLESFAPSIIEAIASSKAGKKE
ncbi:hypothetical protein [Parasulfitobacter algicola]|uniref:Uncharacterized protein n=1 Tax=Parasulfitobacter algicola TaxID=2614809 RepID=A0ABX2IW05_9RHOB|nr:hypothetical protein [Sulfitobacter algicola]NSX55027.1 hypothetical protein [Sulfitobacter algicola]